MGSTRGKEDARVMVCHLSNLDGTSVKLCFVVVEVHVIKLRMRKATSMP